MITEELFTEWRESLVAQWFFDCVQKEVMQQAFDRQFRSMDGKSVDQIALEAVETRGYIAGILAVESLSFSELNDASKSSGPASGR